MRLVDLGRSEEFHTLYDVDSGTLYRMKQDGSDALYVFSIANGSRFIFTNEQGKALWDYLIRHVGDVS